MGLSMEERRILWEIEQELTRTEPGLAVRLSGTGRPRSSSVLHSRRARAAWTLLVVGIIFLLAYTLFSLHNSPRSPNPHRHAPAVHAAALARANARVMPDVPVGGAKSALAP